MSFIVTYTNADGDECITRALTSRREDVIPLIRRNDIYEQRGAWVRNQMGGTIRPTSDKSLGYLLSKMPAFRCQKTNIQIRQGETWEKALERSFPVS